jgi:hypothetical protein
MNGDSCTGTRAFYFVLDGIAQVMDFFKGGIFFHGYMDVDFPLVSAPSGPEFVVTDYVGIAVEQPLYGFFFVIGKPFVEKVLYRTFC